MNIYRRLLVFIIALVPLALSAAEKPPLEVVANVKIDIDRDGKMDRAMLVQHSETGEQDLYLYLRTDDEMPDLSKTPDLFSKNIAGGFSGLEGKDNGSLLITYGCGGCSNDNEFTLTIVYRNHQYLVGGFRLDWDTRQGAGTCDINFLTGKGVVSQGIDEINPKPLKGNFTPTKLADWNHEIGREACDM